MSKYQLFLWHRSCLIYDYYLLIGLWRRDKSRRFNDLDLTDPDAHHISGENGMAFKTQSGPADILVKIVTAFVSGAFFPALIYYFYL